MKKLSIMISLGIAMLFSSCAKDGDSGATGPKGNANVHVWSITKTYNDFYQIGTSGQSNCKIFTHLDIPELNSTYAEGAVFVYYYTSGVEYPLPSTEFIANGISDFTTFNYYEGGVDIFIARSNLQFPNPNYAYIYRVVAAEGSYIRSHPEINWKDPIQVKRFLNINQ